MMCTCMNKMHLFQSCLVRGQNYCVSYMWSIPPLLRLVFIEVGVFSTCTELPSEKNNLLMSGGSQQFPNLVEMYLAFLL